MQSRYFNKKNAFVMFSFHHVIVKLVLIIHVNTKPPSERYFDLFAAFNNFLGTPAQIVAGTFIFCLREQYKYFIWTY